MSIIDFGIGTQLVTIDRVADHLHVPPMALRVILEAAGLNIITIGGLPHIGLWQFRLLLTHLAGFHGRHYDLDRIAARDPSAEPIPRMNHERLREAMGHLIIARRAQKGSIFSELPREADRMIDSWLLFLNNSRDEIAKSALSIVESMNLDQPPPAED